MTSPIFLVVDDEEAIRALIGRALKNEFPQGSVVLLSDAHEILKNVSEIRPDLILIDWILSSTKIGPEICSELKSNPLTKDIPIILISGKRTGLENQCTTIEKGADLFLSKPFTNEQLIRYAKALLKRQKGEKPGMGAFKVGTLVLNRQTKSVYDTQVGSVEMSAKMFDLLWVLAKQSPQPVSNSVLVTRVWKNAVRDKHVNLSVMRLRQKLASVSGVRIDSIPQVGYRLIPS